MFGWCLFLIGNGEKNKLLSTTSYVPISSEEDPGLDL